MGETEKRVIIFGIRGEAGSGKDTMADYLVNKYGFKKLSFATALKKILVILTGWSMEFVNGSNPELRPLRETLIHPFYQKTCRQLLQYIGTDLLRNQLHQDIWIESARNEIKEYIKSKSCSDRIDDCVRIVFTDARFPNEVDMIQGMQGTMFKIVRPNINCLADNTKQHISEADFAVKNEIIINNDRTLDDFYSYIDSYMIDTKHLYK